MSAATDTFSRFVDVLASTLDAHETTAEELASRTHLSRYHFDRLVAAAAGEPRTPSGGGSCSSGRRTGWP